MLGHAKLRTRTFLPFRTNALVRMGTLEATASTIHVSLRRATMELRAVNFSGNSPVLASLATRVYFANQT